MVWKIPDKEFGDNRSKVFKNKASIILAFHVGDFRILRERLGKDDYEKNQWTTKREKAEELLRRETNIYFLSGNLAQHRMRSTPLERTRCMPEKNRDG